MTAGHDDERTLNMDRLAARAAGTPGPGAPAGDARPAQGGTRNGVPTNGGARTRAHPRPRSREDTPSGRRIPKEARKPKKARSAIEKAAARGVLRSGRVAEMVDAGDYRQAFCEALSGLQCEAKNRAAADQAATEWLYLYLTAVVLATAARVPVMRRDAKIEAAIDGFLGTLPAVVKEGDAA